MNAAVKIQSRFEHDALIAPLQTVYGVQGRSFCLVKNGDNYETREVVVGGDNSRMVMFKEGVKAGDELVMNPGAYKDRMDLPEAVADERINLPDNVTLVKTDQPSDNGQRPAPGARQKPREGRGGPGGNARRGGGPGGGRPRGGARPATGAEGSSGSQP